MNLPETWSDERIEALARRVYGKAMTQIEACLDGTQPFNPERIEALAASAHAASGEIPAHEDDGDSEGGF